MVIGLLGGEVYWWARTCVAAFLAGSLVCAPTWGVGLSPVGTVVLSSKATLDRAPARVGVTLYPGDTVETEAGGHIQFRVGGSQVYLLGESAATLAAAGSGVKATLVRGTAGFSLAQPAPVELDTEWATVRSPGQQLANAQVTMLSPTELVVTSYRGALLVEIGGVTHTLAEGHSYRVLISFAAEPEPQGPVGAGTKNGSGNTKTRRKPVGLIILLGAAAAAGGYFFGQWVYHELSESPCGFDH